MAQEERQMQSTLIRLHNKLGVVNMENFIIVVILVIIIGSAVGYIIKEKKKGTKCIGCSHAGTCQKRNDKNNTCS